LSVEDNVQSLCHGIIAATELGADVIKAPLAPANQYSGEDLQRIKRVLQRSSPSVISGGPVHSDIEATARLAQTLGFAGFCVGRAIFTAPDPAERFSTISAQFPN